jgi:hypothetical protein
MHFIFIGLDPIDKHASGMGFIRYFLRGYTIEHVLSRRICHTIPHRLDLSDLQPFSQHNHAPLRGHHDGSASTVVNLDIPGVLVVQDAIALDPALRFSPA